jgi:MFS family permease
MWSLRFANLWLVGFGSYASVYLLLSVLPLYLKRLGLSDIAVGTLLGLMSAAAFVSRPFAGWLADGLGRKLFVVLGALCLFVASVGLPFVTEAVLFALLRLLTGVGWGSLTSNANTLAGELAPAGRRGEAIGLYTMAGSVALAGGPAAGLYLAAALDYPAAFWVAAAFSAAALLGSLVLSTGPTQRRSLPRVGLGTLISRDAAGPALLLLLHSVMYGGLITFLPLLALSRGLGNPGLFFAIYAIALVPLRGLAGRLSDRLGRPQVIAPGLLCGAVSMLLLATAGGTAEMLVAGFLFALAMGFVQPPALAWGLDVGGARRATAMATMVMAQDLGIILGGVLLGAVASIAGYQAPFALAAVPGLAALGALAVASRRGRLSAFRRASGVEGAGERTDRP